MTTLDLLVGALYSLGKLHQLSNRWLGPWFLTNILACVMEEVEFLKEIDVGYHFPADCWARRDQFCSGHVVSLHCIADCLAAVL